MRFLNKALKDRYVHIDKKKDTVTYLPQGKTRKYSYPEEKVQLETYLELIYDFGYPPQKLRVSEKMKIGSSTREADIVVFKDWDCKDPYIIVECKKRKVSKSVFEGAVDQGFSYAAVSNAEYVWATSGDRSAMFRVIPDAIKERSKNRITRLPSHVSGKGFKGKAMRFWQHPVVSDALMYGVVLALCVMMFSKLAVEYRYPTIHNAVQPFLDRMQWNWDFNWYFNAIMGLSTVLSLMFGMVFMRSHRFYHVTAGKKWLSYFLIGLVIFLPAWYVGVNNHDPNWWKWSNYQKWLDKGMPIVVFLWPFVKAFPAQLLTISGMVWLIGRSK
ncbi:type I restriction enzyme HsdR N-terminal domain-containing protein [Pontibacter sp. G13]|uniref:type I restriction enzyme HsdR N-terminal domain-containing protein n=1 Tax=Pontibacter sp. G13 TaxID=3074898 RepID=UPI0028893060|nr:type I restriction enzyme HsdR N-terminal domain-containing protein [Pontibacter sp. G13]WNJ19835.1 type I restriction enzyme HsdR N-terminal domain-containing protein [Pontibacter sp. G13]